MAEVLIKPEDRPAMSAATPTWVTMALGLCVFGALFVIASIIVLSLIPVYLAARPVTVASSPDYSLSPTFSTSWSSGSTLTASNTASLSRQLETAYSLDTGSITVSSATATSSTTNGRRRRQDSKDPSNLPHCNGSTTDPTNVGFSIKINETYCKTKAKWLTCMEETYKKVKTAMDQSRTIEFTFQLPNKTEVVFKAQRCRKYDGAPPGLPSGDCRGCTLTFDPSIYNFFIGTPNATNLTSIFTNGNITRSTATTYVGYPASKFSGTCADLCNTIDAVCASDYALCSLDISNYAACSIAAFNTPCSGISIYADPDGRTGGNPGSPVSCSGSTNYCCCNLRP